MHKLPNKQFWQCWCGRFIWTNNSDKLVRWLTKHLGVESKCQKYRSLSPLFWNNQIKNYFNNRYWSKRLTVKMVTMDEDGVSSREIK